MCDYCCELLLQDEKYLGFYDGWYVVCGKCAAYHAWEYLQSPDGYVIIDWGYPILIDFV